MKKLIVIMFTAIALPSIFAQEIVASQEDPSKPSWVYYAGADDITDEKWHLFITRAVSGSFSEYSTPAFLVSIYETGVVYVSINWSDYVGTDRKLKVAWRVDGSPAIEEMWLASNDGKSTFSPRENVAFFKSLVGVTKFTARVTQYDNTTITAIFDLSGLSTFVSKIPEIYDSL